MAVRCPKCQKQYDVTLFQFGKRIKCDCGEIVDALKPQVEKLPPESPSRCRNDDSEKANADDDER